MSRSISYRQLAPRTVALLLAAYAVGSIGHAAPPKVFARNEATGATRKLKTLGEIRQAHLAREKILFSGDASEMIRQLDSIRGLDPALLLSGYVTAEGELKIYLENSANRQEAVSQIRIEPGTDPEAQPGALAALERQMNSRAWNGDLFGIQESLNKEQIDAQNAKVLDLMLNEPFAPIDTKGLLTGITYQQAQELQRTIQTPHASQISYKGRSFGMCFGRSIISHIEALRRGVHPDAVKKIWVVGKQQGWAYHVATAVRNIDGGWWVMDGFFGLNKVEEWLPKNLRDSDDGRMTFFVTNANRFGPYSSQKYTKVDLFGNAQGDFYNGFFKDYFQMNRDGEKPARWNRASQAPTETAPVATE